ncbi:CoA-binding protein [Winogradskyella sp.]|uniref:CoA-binding protein n=1 Tax=Winogradskyella sp. TaxID=1883156 RepID=UPI003512D278
MSIEYPESYLCDILNEVRTIAVVGASSKKHRDSYKVMQSLIENGYKVFPINPNESGKNILNCECFPSLDAVKENIDMVDIFRAHDAVMDIAKDAIKIGAKVLWMQEGIVHHEAANLATSAGLRVVMDRCPKKELIK